MKKGARVVVAMSGGVDSSATAALLVEQGYDVVGITLHLHDHAPSVPGGKTCCGGEDTHDARRVADTLGIPHYTVDMAEIFKAEVMQAFADSYANGETPVPCIQCNRTVKFRDLVTTARDLGAEGLATGHYVRRVDGPDGAMMLRGTDPARDQSYFLFATTREQLDFLHFPLGSMPKTETRELARRHGLLVADKPDSQDICFVPGGDYARIVESLRPDAMMPGEIVDLAGRVLGQHDGVAGFTVGQRRGLDIGGTADRLYVVRLEPESRRVVVGPREALGIDRFTVHTINWLGLGEAPPEAGVAVAVKVRNSFTPAPAMVYGRDDGKADVVLETPIEAVSPGQAAVFYQGDRLLGGGWISRRAA